MDWTGQWIGGAAPASAEAPMLRREFTLGRPVARATLRVCGLGYCEVSLNGRRVGDHVLDPAFTRYDKRAMFVTYNVTGLVRQGANAVAATLGRGWYGLTTPNVWNSSKAFWHGDPRMLLQIDIEHEDGSNTVVSSDGTWQAATGPTVMDSIYEGEAYDARLERPGWDLPGYDASGWSSVTALPAPTARLEEQRLPPIRVVKTWPAVAMSQPKPGSHVFDLGQNIAGWARLRVEGPAGTTVHLRYGERLRPDGTVDNANDLVYAEAQRDRYTLKGGGLEVWEPRFSYKGFRYVQVDGYPGTPALSAVEGRQVHSDVQPAGAFECSDDTLNAIHRLTLQSLLNNFHSIPTDTPVFEKNGWTGDAHLTANTALFNFDMRAFYGKWLDDCADCQTAEGMIPLIIPCPGWGQDDAPEWGGAFILVAWDLARHTGDMGVFERHYDRMARYIAFLEGRRVDGLSPSVLGDWLPPGYNGNPPEGPQVSAACSLHRCATVMAQTAFLLGKRDDFARFGSLREDVARAVNAHCLDAEAGVYHTDKDVGYRQAPNILALAEGIVPAGKGRERGALKQRVLDNLVADIRAHGNHLNCGILGTKHLLPLLTWNGHVDLAFEVATQRTHPSWGFWLEQGATALWEAWDLNSRSLGHHMFGMIGDWFYGCLAGIIPPTPPFRNWTVCPFIPRKLDRVSASAVTPAGRLAVRWWKGDGALTLEVDAPMETSVRVPGQDRTVTVDAGTMRWSVPAGAF